MRGYRIMTAVGERVGRIVGGEGDYDIVKRSFGRGRYPLRKRDAVVDSKRRRVLIARAAKEALRGALGAAQWRARPATDAHYSG